MKLATAVVLVSVPVALVQAKWAIMPWVDVPIDRALPILERRVREHPEDPRLHYLLGRMHSLAFASTRKVVPVIKGTEGPNAAPAVIEREWIYSTMPDSKGISRERVAHLRAAISQYRIANRLSGNDGLYRMGLAWTFEASAQLGETYLREKPIDFARMAIAEYRRTIDLTLKGDMEDRVAGPNPYASREAANAVLRILQRFPSLSSRELVTEMKGIVTKVDSVPRAITPIIVPLQGESGLVDLLDPKRRSRFDLVGDDLKREWPWVRPTTGILVWDPLRTGQITSGRQLFGSSTWWMFFRDGYEALATLDADGNGWLSGHELKGIRVWVDRDGDGACQPGEVKDLEALGIVGLRTKASGQETTGPYAEQGVRWSSGSTSPTYDWCLVSLRAPVGLASRR